MGRLLTGARGCGRWLRGGRPVDMLTAGCGLLLLAVAFGLLLCGAPALAATGHGFVSSLSGAPAGTPLKEPQALAVDHTSGAVFVADAGRGVVDVYSSAGVYETRFGGGALDAQAIAVAEGSGDVYIVEPFADTLVVYGPDGSGGYQLLAEWDGAGTPSGGFGEVTGVAVDNSTSASDPSTGDVYVVDRESAATERGAVDVFKPKPAGPEEGLEGEFVRRLKGVKLDEPNGVAVSAATGSVYVADSVKGAVDEFSASGAYERKFTGKNSPQGSFRGQDDEEEGNVSAIAVDETTGDLLVAEGERRVVGELNAAGEWVGWVTGSPTGGFGESLGVAVGSSGNVYVADAGSGVVDVFGPGVVVPDVTTGKATEAAGTSEVVLHGTVDGDGKPVSYHFEWGESETYYGSSTPVVEGTGGGEEEAAAVLTGLKPGVTYYYRLVGENNNGANCGVGRALTTVPAESSVRRSASVACRLPPPAIDDESVAEVSSTAAMLRAEIDPLGHDTSYQFQYGSESCQANPGSCTEVPLPPVDVGAGESSVSVSARVGALEPDTTYYYRVLATSSLGVTDGVQRSFTTQPSATASALADGRAWEMVSPPDKYGAAIEALTSEGGLILASEDGDAISYVADGAITEEAQGNRSPEMQQVLSTRGPEGWSSQDIATPNSSAEGVDGGSAPEYQYFTPDLSLALVDPWARTTFSQPPLSAGATQATMYLRDDATDTYVPLVTEANVSPGTIFGAHIHFAGATRDLSHVVLRSTVALTGASSAPGLYEWAGGSLKFVSVLPSGMPAAKPELGFYNIAATAISSDGTRVIWTNADENSGRGHLYVRDTATGETIQLDAAQGVAEPEGDGLAQFQSASSDGSRILFTDKQRLTKGSTAEPGEGNEGKPDLYECELGEEHGRLACNLRDLTVENRAGQHADVQNFLLGASEDDSMVYLVAKGVLAANANGIAATALPGQDNLYELHEEGGEWETTFIAVLSAEDQAEWEGGEHANSAFLTARASPNGRYLAFMSAASPTGYDNEDVTSRHLGERLDEEVYLYDSSTATLRCVSCDPTGARPVGVLDTVESGEGVGLLVDRRKVWGGHWLAGNIPGWTAQSIESAQFQSRYLSDEGRLFFNSADALLPLERPTRKETIDGVEEEVGTENVYEYEPTGTGSCVSVSGGCVALISSGSSPHESAFLEATPSGNDVFFLTAAQLLPQDTDSAFDVYDARVCTQASPCLTPPSPPPAGCSEADACRAASPPQQAPLASSGTASFSGPANPTPQPPAKQEVKDAKTSAKPLTRAQKLANALKACKRAHPHSKKKRAACEAHARRSYGAKPKASKARMGGR